MHPQAFSLVSNAAHPGYAPTNLQTSGPERQKNLGDKILEALMSHDAAHGAMPTLRAATATDVLSGSYFAPDRMFQLKGGPVFVPMPKPAQNDAAARQLWETAEGLTGAAWRVAAHRRPPGLRQPSHRGPSVRP